MDFFITQHLLKHILDIHHQECSSCTRETDEEIISCDVYNNILEDCHKWKLKISATQNYYNRLLSEKKLLNEIKGAWKFRRFWNKNRDKFYIYNLYIQNNHKAFSNKESILNLYDELIKKAENKLT